MRQRVKVKTVFSPFAGDCQLLVLQELYFPLDHRSTFGTQSFDLHTIQSLGLRSRSIKVFLEDTVVLVFLGS